MERDGERKKERRQPDQNSACLSLICIQQSITISSPLSSLTLLCHSHTHTHISDPAMMLAAKGLQCEHEWVHVLANVCVYVAPLAREQSDPKINK